MQTEFVCAPSITHMRSPLEVGKRCLHTLRDDGFMLCLVSFRRKPESSDVNDLHAMMNIPKPWIAACAGMTVEDVGVGGVGCANDFVCAPGSRCNLSLEQVRKHG